MKFKNAIALLAATSLLYGCAQPGGPGVTQGGQGFNKQEAGTVLGAVGGGIVGSNIGKGKGAIAATIGGALLGGLLGNQVGASLDNADRVAYSQAAQTAFNDGGNGQTLPWNNPKSGNSGSITPKNYYQNSQGQYCREYTQTINVGGKTQSGYGTACRQPDGSWQIVE